MMDMVMKFLPSVLSLAFLIIAAVNLGSLNKLRDDKKLEDVQQWKDAQRTSIILLLVSIVMIVYSAYDLYSKKDSLFAKNFIYYF
jgi:hypothetical protein